MFFVAEWVSDRSENPTGQLVEPVGTTARGVATIARQQGKIKCGFQTRLERKKALNAPAGTPNKLVLEYAKAQLFVGQKVGKKC